MWSFSNDNQSRKKKKIDKKKKHTPGNENFQNKHYGWYYSTDGFKKFRQSCANNPNNSKWVFFSPMVFSS